MLNQKPVKPGGEWMREVDKIGPEGDPVVFIQGFAVILDGCHATTGDVVHFEVQRVTDNYAIAEEV